jgi:ABC-type branched-subunit amino acid transport system substrate-binding protein
VALLLTAGLFTACSSSSSTSTTTTTKLPKSPIDLGVIAEITSSTPSGEVASGAKAAAAAINASGGINGHPVVITVCDSKGVQDVSSATTCANNLVANTATVAEVGDYNANQQQINTILAAAGVPLIGPNPVSSSAFTSSNSFPFMGLEGAGLTTVLQHFGAKSISVAYTDVPAAAQAVTFGNLVLAPYNQKVLQGIPVPLTATDLTAEVTQAAKGDGAGLALEPSQLAQWLTVAKQGNFTTKVSASAGSLTPPTLKSLGSNANNMYLTGGLPFATNTKLSGIQKFQSEMKQYEPSALVDEPSLNAWLATWGFAQVARGMTVPITRASLMTAMGQLTNFNIFGLLPEGFSTTKEFNFPQLNRLFNQSVIYGQVQNEKVVQTDPNWVVVLKPLS